MDGYLRDWPQHFDYVLVLNADAAPVTAPAGTCLVSDQGYAKLYRVAAHCQGGRGDSPGQSGEEVREKAPKR